jgi:hypothetical protein
MVSFCSANASELIYNIGFYIAIILQVAFLVHKSYTKATFLPGLLTKDVMESIT